MTEKIFIQAEGGRRYMRIYDIRTQESSYYSDTGRCATSASSPAIETCTSGASSSAQPPVLPSLPSVLSSSTPLSRSVESSPASQLPTVSDSSEPRNKLSLVAGHIYPSSRASRQIMRIIKLHLDKDGYTWDAVPQEARDFYWEEFRKHFVWEEAITAVLKVAWEKLCAHRYADFTYRM
ncbi:hypothetical protein JCGZ_17143 [Jatropha curcas]|uniref:Uncharacterized protein n=1 Tax=Jatropha curcas TaxID=180498 RepID=A0A067K2Q6_JATCU|nr:hypothetical protein JCGZ_17143 [Jatropha curcas]